VAAIQPGGRLASANKSLEARVMKVEKQLAAVIASK